MKARIFFISVFAMLLIATNFSYPGTPTKMNKQIDFETVEANLLEGLSSDNLGLRVSSAHFLGEYKSDKAIIPLLKMLHDEKSEGARIQAALSLIKIGSEKAVSMVRKASIFDESQRVRIMCARFYNTYITNKEKN